MYVICLNVSIFTCYTFVYMYVHALTQPVYGLSFLCNNFLFCSLVLAWTQSDTADKKYSRCSFLKGSRCRSEPQRIASDQDLHCLHVKQHYLQNTPLFVWVWAIYFGKLGIKFIVPTCASFITTVFQQS